MNKCDDKQKIMLEKIRNGGTNTKIGLVKRKKIISNI